MTANSTPPNWTPPPPPSEVKPIVHRSLTLRVDLRAVAALGGALIIVGSFLPWVSAQFQPIVRVLGPITSGGWPILIFGALAIVLQFWTPFRTPRVSLLAAAFGFAAGLLALASALNTIGISRTLLGDTSSPWFSIGIGIYLTLAGSMIAILAGLAPQPPNHEPARADLRLWKASTAIFAAFIVFCGLGGMLFGSWIGTGGSSNQSGTPTPSALDAGLLATPLINVEANPLEEGTPEMTPPSPTVPAANIAPTAELPPTETPISETPVLIPTREPPTATTAATATPTNVPTATLTPLPTATVSSPISTPSTTPTPSITATATVTPTVTLTATPVNG